MCHLETKNTAIMILITLKSLIFPFYQTIINVHIYKNTK